MDLPTKVGVLAGGAALVGLLVFLRFCGDVSVASKPPKPRERVVEPTKASIDEATQQYLAGVSADASRAGIAPPSREELGKAFTFAREDRRFTLVPDGPAVEVLGLQLAARSYREAGSEKLLVLEVTNPGASPVAYLVDTELSGGDASCFGRTILAHDGTVLGPGKTERRSECEFKRGLEMYIARVETAVLTPFAASYVRRVQPQALGARDRVAGGHKPALAGGVQPCNIALAGNVKSGLADGSVRWRDLVDFYARHACDKFQFPVGYRAFESDGERPLPDLGE